MEYLLNYLNFQTLNLINFCSGVTVFLLQPAAGCLHVFEAFP